MRIDIGKYLAETGTVLVTKEAFEYLNKKVDALYAIRAEIETLPTSESTETHCIYINAVDFKEKVLAIFDKYTESEDKK